STDLPQEPPIPPTPGLGAATPTPSPGDEGPFDDAGRRNEDFYRLTPDEQMDWVERMLSLADATLDELDFHPENQSEFERRVLVHAVRRQLGLVGRINEALESQVSGTPAHQRLGDIRDLAEQLRQVLVSIPVSPPESAHPILVPQVQTEVLGPVAQTPDDLARRLEETLRAQDFRGFEQAAEEVVRREEEYSRRYPPLLGVLGLVAQTLDVVELQVAEAMRAGDRSGLEQALHELEGMEHSYPLRSDHLTKLQALKDTVQAALQDLHNPSAAGQEPDASQHPMS